MTTRGLLSLLGISRGLRCFDLTNVDRVCYFLPRGRVAQSEVEVNFVTGGQKAWSLVRLRAACCLVQSSSRMTLQVLDSSGNLAITLASLCCVSVFVHAHRQFMWEQLIDTCCIVAAYSMVFNIQRTFEKDDMGSGERRIILHAYIDYSVTASFVRSFCPRKNFFCSKHLSLVQPGHLRPICLEHASPLSK